METMKQARPESVVSLVQHAGGTDAWGTELGATVFANLNLDLIGLSEGTLVPLDYEGLERSDASFQREAVVETLRKHRPRLLFIAVNLSDPDVRSNLELALEKRGDCLLIRENEGCSVIGKRLTAEHRATLEAVWDAGRITSSDLGSETLKLSTASSRLAWLWRAGLVERVEGTSPSGGREHRYHAIT
jgi:hypothetical protein